MTALIPFVASMVVMPGMMAPAGGGGGGTTPPGSTYIWVCVYSQINNLAQIKNDLNEYSWTNTGSGTAQAPSHQIQHHEKREITGSATNEPAWTAPFTPLTADDPNQKDNINVGGESVPAGYTIYYCGWYNTQTGQETFNKVDQSNVVLETATRNRIWNVFDHYSYWTWPTERP